MWVGIPIAPIPESSIVPSRTLDPIPGFPLNIRLPQIPDLSILSPRTYPRSPGRPGRQTLLPAYLRRHQFPLFANSAPRSPLNVRSPRNLRLRRDISRETARRSLRRQE